MRIDKNINIPYYQQVKNVIEEKLLSEEWPPGYQLPTEKELAAYFDVSTITVKRGILELVNEGLLYRERGRGTFVNKKEEKSINKMVTLISTDDNEEDYPHKTISFELKQAGVKIGKALQVDESELIYSINRVKLDNEVPVSIEYTYIPQKCTGNLEQSLLEEDLIYNVLTKKYGLKLKKAKIFISTILAGEKEADILNIPIGQQLFVLERYTFNVNDALVEYSYFVIKKDNFNYFIEVTL
ncbi:GntR family transcriptional regulator [Sporosarcina sp. ACRSM]|uniref:GntR family transcriptional regulator n=1 Tax=Sporosarcina sp. ACRSM TaxID=2918216 RepID=UPI001EF73A8A|nr:GntR family transcriptional regulator [Sporosarcina sp. ACRSM]